MDFWDLIQLGLFSALLCSMAFYLVLWFFIPEQIDHLMEEENVGSDKGN